MASRRWKYAPGLRPSHTFAPGSPIFKHGAETQNRLARQIDIYGNRGAAPRGGESVRRPLGPVYTSIAARRDAMYCGQVDRSRRSINVATIRGVASLGVEVQTRPYVSYAQPLEWFAGFQPLLLTLPDGILTKSVHWISLRDHRRHETVASVLLPNGPAFQIPSVVELRGLSPNGAYNISSGPIRVGSRH
ncbi:unnamed protein product [Heligmosomoides polygyrus]|uniref:Oxidored_molyb domain-containing protein n=1 Tax=Heligmosomoides polygyrus TaxID=6339 RepID=A0A183FK79_HELPZ|nr:unnamed protein product [Heligmosomoides polygyrus]